MKAGRTMWMNRGTTCGFLAAFLMCSIQTAQADSTAQPLPIKSEAVPKLSHRLSGVPTQPQAPTLDAARPRPTANDAVPLPSAPAASTIDIIHRIGTLQFLTATIIKEKKEEVLIGDDQTITRVTTSLKIVPIWGGSRGYGISATATF